jgi:hypothetical protein
MSLMTATLLLGFSGCVLAQQPGTLKDNQHPPLTVSIDCHPTSIAASCCAVHPTANWAANQRHTVVATNRHPRPHPRPYGARGEPVHPGLTAATAAADVVDRNLGARSPTAAAAAAAAAMTSQEPVAARRHDWLRGGQCWADTSDPRLVKGSAVECRCCIAEDDRWRVLRLVRHVRTIMSAQ